ncbi:MULTISPECIES: Sec-independent protein translocase protein TatB [unclassified Halomonas]|uniref:Sec-independent protein translocase protein TatB n=1 Tax=unclassified Halomonas TaxID=2609666 RepID=UPI00288833BF|nr:MULTISPECIES: Sec-independent protein translocase protein TatB [unclassified Halomonas]MDT0502398.1 Sec-independent protein translocase protein TatB [Halomonas sp. PAR7]MDT0511952.1 Sec-independent protein translocase protein TatB [Halomonas sp. LES1]MDT0590911.1 Sec-independent protein translocase protein TatB [Halomonas sp. PAR8]
MFDIGFLELLLLGVVGLLVLGPERLPKAARTLGLWIGKIKRTVSGMQREISAQLEAEELRQKLDEQQKKLDDSVSRVKHGVEGLAKPEGGTHDAEKPPRQGPAASPEQRLDDALARAREGAADADAAPQPSSVDKDAPQR